MAEYTVTISLPDHKRSDKWAGIASIWPKCSGRNCRITTGW